MAQPKDENGLTPRQKRFATLLATKPDVPQYKLALEAGVPISHASVWAAKTARLPWVQAYYQKLTSAAVNAIKTERAAIASIAETLEFHTAVMRGRIGKFIKPDGSVDIKRVRKAKGGAIKKYRARTQSFTRGDEPVTETTAEIELSDPQASANALLSHFQKAGGMDKPAVSVAVISGLPTDQRVSIIKAFLSQPAE